MTVRRVCALLVTLAALVLGAVACESPPPVPPKKEVVAQWADALDRTPDIYAVIRPQALKRDGIYGAFWKSLLRVAQARGFTRGASMVDAAEGSEEIILGLNKGADALLVLRGVPASVDPLKVADAQGQPLFRAVNERTKVPEYELSDRRNVDGALFVLPDRTWVGTLGESRNRARHAFASPLGRPSPEVETDALAMLRFEAPIVRLFERHPNYGVLTKRLTSVTFTLKPGKGGLVIGLVYDEAGATAQAEMFTKQIIQDLVKDEKRFGWLKNANVKYEGNIVFVRVAVPPRLLEELPNASGADLGF